MDYVVFKQWLQDEKNMSIRSATDAGITMGLVERVEADGSSRMAILSDIQAR